MNAFMYMKIAEFGERLAVFGGALTGLALAMMQDDNKDFGFVFTCTKKLLLCGVVSVCAGLIIFMLFSSAIL